MLIRVPMRSMVMWISSPLCEGEGVGRDDAGAGQEEAAAGKAVVAEEIFDEWADRVSFRRSGGRRKTYLARLRISADLCGGGHGFAADEDAGAEGAAAVVDLGLREVERVFAFDVARAHVVADGVADDLRRGD